VGGGVGATGIYIVDVVAQTTVKNIRAALAVDVVVAAFAVD